MLAWPVKERVQTRNAWEDIHKSVKELMTKAFSDKGVYFYECTLEDPGGPWGLEDVVLKFPDGGPDGHKAINLKLHENQGANNEGSVFDFESTIVKLTLYDQEQLELHLLLANLPAPMAPSLRWIGLYTDDPVLCYDGARVNDQCMAVCMDRVDTSLEEYVLENREDNPNRIFEALRYLCEALTELQRRYQFMHNDLQCRNVMIHKKGQVLLIDLEHAIDENIRTRRINEPRSHERFFNDELLFNAYADTSRLLEDLNEKTFLGDGQMGRWDDFLTHSLQARPQKRTPHWLLKQLDYHTKSAGADRRSRKKLATAPYKRGRRVSPTYPGVAGCAPQVSQGWYHEVQATVGYQHRDAVESKSSI